LRAQTCKAKETGEDGILREISGLFGRVFGSFFFGAFAQFQRWAVGTAVGTTPQSVPFAATGSGHAEGTKRLNKNPGNSFKLGFEPIVINGFTNLWPLALFSAVFYWVSLG